MKSALAIFLILAAYNAHSSTITLTLDVTPNPNSSQISNAQKPAPTAYPVKWYSAVHTEITMADFSFSAIAGGLDYLESSSNAVIVTNEVNPNNLWVKVSLPRSCSIGSHAIPDNAVVVVIDGVPYHDGEFAVFPNGRLVTIGYRFEVVADFTGAVSCASAGLFDAGHGEGGQLISTVSGTVIAGPRFNDAKGRPINHVRFTFPRQPPTDRTITSNNILISLASAPIYPATVAIVRPQRCRDDATQISQAKVSLVFDSQYSVNTDSDMSWVRATPRQVALRILGTPGVFIDPQRIGCHLSGTFSYSF